MKAWAVVLTIACGIPLSAEDSARRAAPAYTASSIVNSGNYTAGPLAPNTLVTIFGTDLSFYEATGVRDVQGALPMELGNVRVVVGNLAAPLYYVSPSQINFIVPAGLRAGNVKLYVARQGLAGPVLDMTMVDSAPATFKLGSDSIIAVHASGELISADSPAKRGEVIVVYATGLGNTNPALPQFGPPTYPALMSRFSDLRVVLNGAPITQSRVLYGGVTPGWLGLYQVNVAVPDDAPENPEIRLSVGDLSSVGGLRLPLH